MRATQINEEMKLAAARALADLAKQEVPELVSKSYGGKKFSYGRDYIIPKPFDPRVFVNVSMAVAKAAIETGVAKKPYASAEAYRKSLEERAATIAQRYEIK